MDGKRISNDLMAMLSYVSESLINATTEEGRLVMRKTKNGYSFTRQPAGHKKTKVLLFFTELNHIIELGHLLAQIAAGKNARAIFRQNENTKPKKTDEHRARALAYWSIRAVKPSAKDTAALKKARSILAGGERLSDATLRKIAQKYRAYCVGTDECPSSILGQAGKLKDLEFQDGPTRQTVTLRSKDQITALREYLRDKTEARQPRG